MYSVFHSERVYSVFHSHMLIRCSLGRVRAFSTFHHARCSAPPSTVHPYYDRHQLHSGNYYCYEYGLFTKHPNLYYCCLHRDDCTAQTFEFRAKPSSLHHIEKRAAAPAQSLLDMSSSLTQKNNKYECIRKKIRAEDTVAKARRESSHTSS